MHRSARAVLRRLALLPTLALAGACSASLGTASESGAVSARLDEPFTLQVGQVAEVQGTGPAPFRVTLVGVTNDSRCGADVQCVWEGDARVVLRLERGAAAADTAAHTSG